jgi:hypothetical protein
MTGGGSAIVQCSSTALILNVYSSADCSGSASQQSQPLDQCLADTSGTYIYNTCTGGSSGSGSTNPPTAAPSNSGSGSTNPPTAAPSNSGSGSIPASSSDGGFFAAEKALLRGLRARKNAHGKKF